MIQHEKTDGGGSVRVKSPDGFAVVAYTLSNPTSPLSVQCSISGGSTPRFAVAVMESLVQKYTPSVLFVETSATELKYKPKIDELFRCWTADSQSLYAEAFSSRELFNRVCSITAAMQNYDFVRVNSEEMQFFRTHDVMKKIRENTKPFEFLNIKEECDYSIRGSCVDCVRDLVSTARNTLNLLPEKQQIPFLEALNLIENKQRHGGYAFDTKHSYIQETVNALVLPAIVKYGNHQFTQNLVNALSKTTSSYVSASEEFLNNYAEILESNSSD